MDQYKEYKARTYQDRIALDMLCALDKIVELLTPVQQEIIQDAVIIEPTTQEVTNKSKRKKG